MRTKVIGIRNKELGELSDAKKLMKRTLKEVSTIPDKPPRTTFEKGVFTSSNLLYVTDSAMP